MEDTEGAIPLEESGELPLLALMAAVIYAGRDLHDAADAVADAGDILEQVYERFGGVDYDQ